MELDDLLTPRGHRIRSKIKAVEKEREKRLEAMNSEFYANLRRACDAFVELLAQSGYVEDKPTRARSPSARPPPERNQIPIGTRHLKGIQPPLFWAVFGACHNIGSITNFSIGSEKRPTARFRYSNSYIALPLTNPLPLELRNASTKKEEVAAWIQGQAQTQLNKLDTETWDIVVWILVTFFSQEGNADASKEFEVWITDYFTWRGVAPSNRSVKRRQEVVDRIRLLSTLYFQLDEGLYQKDSSRQKKPLPQSGFFLKAISHDEDTSSVNAQTVAFRITLGEWAQPYIKVSAMLGVYYRRLSEYDQARQKWERQIGWYLVAMMQAQGSKMRFKQINEHVEVTPQQGLRMESILTGASLTWKKMQRNDGGVIISQFVSALETLKRDQIIGDYKCQAKDGSDLPVDGSDLPVRGRLNRMLGRTYMIWPGPDMIQHLWAKAAAREQGQSRKLPRNKDPRGKANDMKGSNGGK